MSEPLVLHIPALTSFPLELWIVGTRTQAPREELRAQEQAFSAHIRAEVGDRLLSLTHSQGMTVGLVGEPSTGWGIDLEFADRPVSEKARARFWSQQEQARAPELTAIAVWTLKESALKARGRGAAAQTISEWVLEGVTDHRSQRVYHLVADGLKVRGVLLPTRDHGIPQGILAVAFLERPADDF